VLLDNLCGCNVQCFEYIFSEELFVSGAEWVSVLKVAVRDIHVLLAHVLTPALLHLQLKEHSCLGSHVVGSPLVCLFHSVLRENFTYFFDVSGHVKESFTDTLSSLNLKNLFRQQF